MPGRVAQDQQVKRQHRRTDTNHHGLRAVEERCDVELHLVQRGDQYDEMQAKRGGSSADLRLGHAQGTQKQRYTHAQAKHRETAPLRQ
ncbi:hypothetical protein D9M71_775420 [compost metagenome]